MSQEQSSARQLYGHLETAKKVVDQFAANHGHPPSDIELRIAATLFIEDRKASREGRNRGGGEGGGNRAKPYTPDTSIPILRRKPPFGKHKAKTWHEIIQSPEETANYVEWALQNARDWFSDEDARVLRNAYEQRGQNGGEAGVGSSTPDLTKPDDPLPF